MAMFHSYVKLPEGTCIDHFLSSSPPNEHFPLIPNIAHLDSWSVPFVPFVFPRSHRSLHEYWRYRWYPAMNYPFYHHCTWYMNGTIPSYHSQSNPIYSYSSRQILTRPPVLPHIWGHNSGTSVGFCWSFLSPFLFFWSPMFIHVPWISAIPSGKRSRLTVGNHHFSWEISLFLWPCSIANCESLPEGISLLYYHHSLSPLTTINHH